MGRYTLVKYGDDKQLENGTGKTVDKWTRAALVQVAKDLGYSDGLTLTQGSPSTGVAASAGTHAGHGVVDLPSNDWERKVAALRRRGFAAWRRKAIPGLWGEHIHAVLVGHPKLSPAAAAQVEDYLAGRDGLAGHGPDDGPRDWVGTRYRWERGRKRIRAAGTSIDEALEALQPRRNRFRGYSAAVRRVREALTAARDALPKIDNE